jgi:hypothetical protein
MCRQTRNVLHPDQKLAMYNLLCGYFTYCCAVNDSDIDLGNHTDPKVDRKKCLQYSGEHVRRAKSVLSCIRKHKSNPER